MIERNGPGFIKTERRSPMIASGVARPKQASTNITTVIAMPATSPASNPAKRAFDLLIILGDYLLLGRLCQAPDYFFASAIRINVAMIRAPATNVPRSVPETFETPPARRR